MNFMQSEAGIDPVVVEGVFNAPVERVFRAWTDTEEIKAWFGAAPHSVAAAEIDLRVGGRWCLTFPPSDGVIPRLEGEYLEIVTNSRLVFTWTHVRTFADGHDESTAPSRVTVTFEPMGKATRVALRHEGIRTVDGRLGVGKGWSSSFASLQALCAQADGAAA